MLLYKNLEKNINSFNEMFFDPQNLIKTITKNFYPRKTLIPQLK